MGTRFISITSDVLGYDNYIKLVHLAHLKIIISGMIQ